MREAEDFNPAAVTEHLKAQGRAVPDHMPDPASLRVDSDAVKPAGGCPGAALQTLTPCGHANVPTTQSAGSALSHWPVQLRLVPPTAPFLRNADLLLTADCVPVAMPRYHGEYVPNRVVVMGCPKFDDQQAYVDKLADIIAESDLKSITVMEMEVPCCSSMSAILREAVKSAGKSVDTVRVTVARTGEVLETVPVLFGA